MQTDEERVKYATETEDSINNARAMIGWDSEPSVVVEPPRKVTVRHKGKMVEREEPAWVKFSTDFKAELKNLDEYSLKVFLYIGLSIGFENGTAYPGVRKIAQDTGMNKDTVQKCIEDLEGKGFMSVYRREGNSNIYKPTRYMSIGTVPPDRTPDGEPSGENAELSGQNEKLSGAQEGKMHNKNNKTINKRNAATPRERTPDKPKPPKANDFPSNVLYREVTERYPPKANWHMVLKAISDIERRIGRAVTRDDLFPFFEAWCAKGWKPTNLAWLTEWAVTGSIPQKTRNATESIPKGISASIEWLREKGLANGD